MNQRTMELHYQSMLLISNLSLEISLGMEDALTLVTLHATLKCMNFQDPLTT